MEYINWVINHLFEILGAVVLFAFWFTYGIVPLVVKQNMVFNRDLTIEEYDPEEADLDTYQPDDDEDYQLPLDLEEHFAEQIEQMLEIGFDYHKYYVIPDMLPNAGAIFCTFFNQKTQDLAMATVIHAVEMKDTVLNDDSLIDNAIKTKTITYEMYVEFMSQFTDGSQVCTMNSNEMQGFKTGPMRLTYQLPTTKDLNTLYAVHQRKSADAISPKSPLPQENQWIDFLREDIVDSFDQQVDYGLLKLNEPKQKYTMTWKSMIYMVYPNLWPFKGMVMRKVRAKEQKLLKEVF